MTLAVLAAALLTISARKDEPASVVHAFASAASDQDFAVACDLLTVAGRDQLGLAARGAVRRFIGREKLDGRFESLDKQSRADIHADIRQRAQAEEMKFVDEWVSADDCESLMGYLLDPTFAGTAGEESAIIENRGTLSAQLGTDAESAAQDTDVSSDGDEAIVSTDAGAWQLNELNGRWYVSEVPHWSSLAVTGAAAS